MTTYVLKEGRGLTVRPGPVTIYVDPEPSGARLVATTQTASEPIEVRRLGTGVAILPEIETPLVVGIESGNGGFPRGTSITLRLRIDADFDHEPDEIQVHSAADVSGENRRSLFVVAPVPRGLEFTVAHEASTPPTVLPPLAEAARVSAVRHLGGGMRSGVDSVRVLIDGSASFKAASGAGLQETLEILLGTGTALAGPESLQVSIVDSSVHPVRWERTEEVVADIVSAFDEHPLTSTFAPRTALERTPNRVLSYLLSDAPSTSSLSTPSLDPSDEEAGRNHDVVLIPAAGAPSPAASTTVISATSLSGPVGLDDPSRTAELDEIVGSLLAPASLGATTHERISR